ncbi:MAG: tripartite tricarboxylate transporter permease [Candidatus Accumulibacter sp.]|jgi:putative tricarboxylic transport membrane protein|nr:tripartite tricarboxylate transporter permease [Accumulibacter sp.]
MEEFQAFIRGFGMIFEPGYFLLMFGGVTFGLILGALPGLTGSMGIALMLPFTYNMSALPALVFLLSIYSGGLFGGAITAILINTPGSPANVATVLDGYPMNLRGQSEEALGVALYSSVAGGLIGCVFLVMVMEPLANLSLQFGPSEMFMVAIFGLSVVGSLSSNILKSVFAGLVGILLGTIGMSPSGAIRGTMGSYHLLDGIPLIPALIGFLAIPELFNLSARGFVVETSDTRIDIRRIVRSGWMLITRPFQVFFCATIGVVVGVMPAAGATIASLLSYNQSKQLSKKYAEFGTGIPEGIIASETASSSSEGGALATMLVLGIPGSASTAMLLGALMIQGWIPGPRLFIDNKEIIYASISSLFMQQFVMLVMGTLLCLFSARLIKLPVKYLLPCIVLFTVLGTFSYRNAVFDAGLMLAFGIVGWFLKRNEFPIMPLVLGIILGPIADRELLRIGQVYDNMFDIFQRPITLGLFILSVLSILMPLALSILRARKKEAKSG